MRFKPALLLAFAAVCAFAAAPSRAETAAAGDELVVVVNAKSPLGDSATRRQLKDVYMVKMKFIKEARLRPVHLSDEEIYARFLKEFLGSDVNGYRQWLLMAVFSKGGEAPKSMGAAQVLDAVAAAPGGVGYVLRKDFAARAQLKLLTIIEK